MQNNTEVTAVTQLHPSVVVTFTLKQATLYSVVQVDGYGRRVGMYATTEERVPTFNFISHWFLYLPTSFTFKSPTFCPQNAHIDKLHDCQVRLR